MNPFEYIRERITEIADTLAAVDGRDPSWDYADITQLLDNIEKDYNAKYGSSDVVYRSDAIEACHKDYDSILDFKSNGWTVASSFEEILNALPPAQPEITRCSECQYAIRSRGKPWICKHPDNNAWRIVDDFYCGRAERREDESG